MPVLAAKMPLAGHFRTMRDIAPLFGWHRVESGTEHYSFPDSHWLKIRTNNPLERIIREIRPRTRVVGALPDGQNCLNLAAARLRHIAASQWSKRKYMNMDPLDAERTSTHGAVP